MKKRKKNIEVHVLIYALVAHETSLNNWMILFWRKTSLYLTKNKFLSAKFPLLLVFYQVWQNLLPNLKLLLSLLVTSL